MFTPRKIAALVAALVVVALTGCYGTYADNITSSGADLNGYAASTPNDGKYRWKVCTNAGMSTGCNYYPNGTSGSGEIPEGDYDVEFDDTVTGLSPFNEYWFGLQTNDAAGGYGDAWDNRGPVRQVKPGRQSMNNGWGSFTDDRFPAALWRPYTDATISPPANSNPPTAGAGKPGPNIWNTPLGTRQTHSDSTLVADLTTRNGGSDDPLELTSGDEDQEYEHAVYYHPLFADSGKERAANEGDTTEYPYFLINCSDNGGTCTDGLGADTTLVRGPRNMLPAGGNFDGSGDHHISVIDQIGEKEYGLWKAQVLRPEGTTGTSSNPHLINARGGGIVDIGNDEWIGADQTALWSSGSAGILRGEELANGRIDHALFVLASSTGNDSLGDRVYPSEGVSGMETNSMPMGQLYSLDLTTTQIDALSEPTWFKGVLKAIRTYGLYVGDGGGGGGTVSWEFSMESAQSFESLGDTDRSEQVGDFLDAQGDTRISQYNGNALWSMDFDWASHLVALDPCSAAHTC